MKNLSNVFLPSGEFADLCHTTKATLRHYEKNNILSPAQIKGNKYRYYTPDQIFLYDFIRDEVTCGKSLSQIREMLKTHPFRRHTENTVQNLETLKEQKMRIEREIHMLEAEIIADSVLFTPSADNNQPFIVHQERELGLVVTCAGNLEAIHTGDYMKAVNEHLHYCIDVLSTSRYPWGQYYQPVPGTGKHRTIRTGFFSVFPFEASEIPDKDRYVLMPAGDYTVLRTPAQEYDFYIARKHLQFFLETQGRKMDGLLYEIRMCSIDAGVSPGRQFVQLYVKTVSA